MSLRGSLLFCVAIFASVAACSANQTGTGALVDGNSGGSSNKGGSSGSGSGSGNNSGGTTMIRPPSQVSPDCGDGKHQDGEECDDGNTTGNDGCSPGCQVETDWTCPEAGPCANNAVCGNGSLSASETCDDGNTTDGDGCSANCQMVEAGWQCRVPGKKCVPLCGDGVIVQSAVATEACDDGNAMNDDGCSSTCLIEPNWSCAGTPSVCTKAQCGNSMVETGESCDKGMENGLFYGDGTGCSKTCTNEPKCRDADGKTRACDTACGDGNIDEGEDCDDGNQLDNDGCSKACKVEGGFTCKPLDKTDTVPCPSNPQLNCLVLPMTFRDFDPSTNPDFFYLGKNSVTCVPDASGTPTTVAAGGMCPATDQSGPCLGLASATLDKDGKPGPGTTSMCRCIFTDHDDTGVIASAGTCSRSDGSTRHHIDTMITAVHDIKKWYAGTGTHGVLELAQSGTQFQFSSSVMGAPAGAMGTTIADDIHANCLGTARPLQSGFFPFDPAGSHTTPGGTGDATTYCNLWPYWALGTSATTCATSASSSIKGQWDPTVAWDACGAAAMAGTGTFVPKSDGTGTALQGQFHNFYYTTEARYLFRYSGPASLSFFGDDDVFVYINGKLKLDLGAPHQRLMGMVNIGDATDNLEMGKIYEIAVFHADRHPRDANYQLTLSSFSTSQSSCIPTCGDGVATASEECDLGKDGNTGAYGGCTADCHYGGWCGDGTPQMPEEECDNGIAGNGKNYVTSPPTDPNHPPCTVGCKMAHWCGDGQIDAANGEQCDDGANNGKGACQVGCQLSVK
jgi:fibro-slime domain-containing protein